MLRSVLLTWKMHRFEVVFVVIVLAVLGVSVWVTSSHIAGLGLSDACWPRPEDGGYATPTCDALMERFWPMDAQAGYLRVALTIAPGILGIVLGVPIVAQARDAHDRVLRGPSRPAGRAGSRLASCRCSWSRYRDRHRGLDRDAAVRRPVGGPPGTGPDRDRRPGCALARPWPDGRGGRAAGRCHRRAHDARVAGRSGRDAHLEPDGGARGAGQPHAPVRGLGAEPERRLARWRRPTRL